jgi:uncharacterized protein YwqG
MNQPSLDQRIAPLIKPAIKLEVIDNEQAEAASCESKIGGQPYAEQGDCWPVCPDCNNELSFVCQLKHPQQQELVVFYYCNECGPWGLADESEGQWVSKLYPSPSMEKLSLIQRQSEDEQGFIPCLVNASTVNTLPDWEGLDLVDEAMTKHCCELDDDAPWEAYDAAVERSGALNDYATLIGGYPRFVQGAVLPHCPQCQQDMEFFAQIDSEEQADMMWGDLGVIYLFRCAVHRGVFKMRLQCH